VPRGTMRLIIGEGTPFFNMAMDEAMLLLRGINAIEDTLRLYVMKPSAVTIGYFQSLSQSVSLEYVRKQGIPVVRRISGGGSVYHDSLGEVTYAVILSADLVPNDYLESFKLICEGVVRAARCLNCEASFAPLNDVVAHGRKLSGSAQARKLGALLQHGTFMYATDIDTLANTLRVSRVKYGGASTIRKRVITVSECAGRRVSREEAIEALIEGFAEALNVEFIRDKYSPAELELAKSLEWKYRSREWTALRP